MIKQFIKLIQYGRHNARQDGAVIAFLLVLQILLKNLDVFVRKADSRKRGLPSILVSTLPKSGSMYIIATMIYQYRLHPVLTGEHGFPYSPLNNAQMKDFAIGSSIDQGHYMPSVKNLTLLKKYHINKIVVHFRDPRQTLVSWVYYLDKYHQTRNVFETQDIDIPLDYFEKSFAEKMEIMIKLYYSYFIEFIDKWLIYSKEGIDTWGIEVLFTEFKKMKADPEDFFDDIRRFYGMQPVGFDHHNSPAAAHSHDRKGELDEWQQVLTAEQIRRTSALITDEMSQRFGWRKDVGCKAD